MAPLTRPREPSVRKLYALSMNQCAFPGCTTRLVTVETGTIVGEVCHIRAQNVGGPRYMESQDDEERHGFDNLILMCGNHHKEIDTTANLDIYTEEWLFETKRAHEDEGRRSGELDAPPNVITALLWGVEIYEAGSTHMDFRDATFKVGGEGGSLLGGGGSGGVLTIVGIASLPPSIRDEMTIELEGGPGKSFGAGGGGGGILVFEGRPATTKDLDDGLKVPLLFPANGIALGANGLLDVLGAGWEHCWVDDVPQRITAIAAFSVEFGSIEPNALLGFEIAVTDQSGIMRGQQAADVSVPERQGTINRRSGFATVTFDVEATGQYELSMSSGGACFARYTFEVRLR